MPNIVKVENFGVLPDGSPYLLMERLHGCTLRSVLREAQRRQGGSSRRDSDGVEARSAHPYLTAEVLLQIVRQIGQGLVFAHTASPPVVHRDIKPENVFLHHPRHTREVEVKLLDFGIATVLEEDRMARDDDVAGSPPYMPPEVPARQPVTVAADIYSIAVLIYELVTLHSPWRERIRSPADVLRAHEQEPLPPSHWKPWITPALDDLLVRALATEPAHRPPLSELLEGLGELSRLDDGSAKHRIDADSAVTTDPGLEGLVRAATGEGFGRTPRPLSLVMPARGVPVASPPMPLGIAEPFGAVTGSARSVSMEEVVGTLDHPGDLGARKGRWRPSVALAALAAAAALLAVAAGAWRVWTTRVINAPAATAEPVRVPEVVRPEPEPAWIVEHSLPSPAPSPTNPSAQAGPVPARVIHKASSAMGVAPFRPKLNAVDEALSHPPVIPKATIVDEFLLNPPAMSAGGSARDASPKDEGRGVRAAAHK
jgi:hypothetical protein